MIHVIFILIFSIVFSYNLISYYFVLRKSNNIFGLNVPKFKYNIFISYIYHIKEKIEKLEKPYNLDLGKYLFIKYVISFIFLILVLIRSENFILSLLLFLIIFYIPNFLLYVYKQKEKKYILRDLITLSYNLRLLFNVNISLYEALKVSCNNLKYKKLQNALYKFNEEYRMYNFNINKASQEILNKFNIEELNTLINILDENQNDENTVNLLKSYKELLNFKMYKIMKRNSLEDIYIILILSIILLINTFIIIIYPISAQIIDNLNIILN